MEDNEKCKLLWDFSIQTDKKLYHNRPDIVLVDKQSKSCLIIDVACPNDWRVESKQEEKVNNYLDLAFEIKKLWKMKRVKVALIVIGALGTVPKNNNNKMGTGVGQIGALAYHGEIDAPAHQSLGWHLWQVPATPKPTWPGLQQKERRDSQALVANPSSGGGHEKPRLDRRVLSFCKATLDMATPKIKTWVGGPISLVR